MRPESTAETTPADSAHNHPPRCCCLWFQVPPDEHVYGVRVERDTCPRCPCHGVEVEAEAAECPSCHTLAGRPHTDYCQAVAPADYPGQPDHCTYPRGDYGDGRGCQDDHCPRHGSDPEPDPYEGRQVYTRNDGSVI